jgi:chromosome segregation ATPase
VGVSVDTASYADLLVMVAALKEENESLKSALSRACNFQLIAENESVALMKDIDRLKNSESLALADLHSTRQRAGQLEHELLALKARVAELEGECDDDQLLNKYAVCINGAVTQHVYSRVNSDAQSVYERLVDIHHYNPEISVHFVACEVTKGPSQ